MFNLCVDKYFFRFYFCTKSDRFGGKRKARVSELWGYWCYNITWLWNIVPGINGDEVESRVLTKSHGTGKTFPGLNCLKTISGIQGTRDVATICDPVRSSPIPEQTRPETAGDATGNATGNARSDDPV